jgi:hypothetical protein
MANVPEEVLINSWAERTGLSQRRNCSLTIISNLSPLKMGLLLNECLWGSVFRLREGSEVWRVLATRLLA